MNLDKIWILEEELVLVFLFTKYNIISSSTTIELYSSYAVLTNMPFNITSIVCTFIFQCMEQARECIQHPKMAKPILIFLSLIVNICLNHGINLSSTDTMTHHIEPFTDIMNRRSMSTRLEQLSPPTSKNNSLTNHRSKSSDVANSAWRTRSRTRRIIISSSSTI